MGHPFRHASQSGGQHPTSEMVSGGQHPAEAFLGKPESEEYIGLGQRIHTPQQPAAHRVMPALWRFAWVDRDQESNLRWSAEHAGTAFTQRLKTITGGFFGSYKSQTRLNDEDLLDLVDMDAGLTPYLLGDCVKMVDGFVDLFEHGKTSDDIPQSAFMPILALVLRTQDISTNVTARLDILCINLYMGHRLAMWGKLGDLILIEQTFKKLEWKK